MNYYFLLKSEPDVYSWDNLVKEKVGRWDGVRNYQARNYLISMKKNDLAFFYHSNIGKEIIGIVKVVREAYPDPTDEKGKFVCVDVTPVKKFLHPITLAAVREHPKLHNLLLLRQNRLSVMPIAVDEWEILCQLGNGK